VEKCKQHEEGMVAFFEGQVRPGAPSYWIAWSALLARLVVQRTLREGTPSSSCAARHHTIPRHRPLYTRSSMLLAWSGPAGPQWGSSSGLQTYYGVMFCDVCERSVGHAACNEALRSESVSLVTCGVTPRCHHPITLVSPNDSEAIIS
jgi:hypothetical protein